MPHHSPVGHLPSQLVVLATEHAAARDQRERERALSRKERSHTRTPTKLVMVEDDFAFPTTVPGSAAPGGASSSSRLWPFAAPLVGETTTTTAAGVKKEDEVEAPAAADDDEDRMGMLWDDTAAERKTTKTVVVRAEPEQHPAAAKPAQEDALDDDERAAAVAEQERMDQLWESFNEELLLLRQWRAGKQHGPDTDWYLCPSSAADESEASSPGRARHGCAPAMLRASSRAGGAGQFSRRRGRSGGGWALLLRLFSAGDKPQPPRRRQSFYVP
jgi:hypothetical protein